jgi:hypothetical protein
MEDTMLNRARPIPLAGLVGVGLAILAAGCDTAPLVPEGAALAERPGSQEAPAHVREGGGAVHAADIRGQGPGGAVVVENGATLRRTPNGISVKVSMPTPEPGAYAYPEGAEPGHPEAFTLWVFVFDDPDAEEWSGAFHGAGHVVGGPQLTLSGHVSRSTDPFVGEPLENPSRARVHLAVAPHGSLSPEQLPEQIQVPSGTPEHWWLAYFD